ncbi:hypothetical protein ASPTUDRAFT_231761 [Aspergillus tubingensis CBS 134.48]|uniref:Uncharacterized protein n=1 Tax=Aspergillus tubingensis (strain CBS 134.48) TaxID=767770 RepID=A0A1L9NLZ9_ASPTC|nr:hypothetical protein ASPTUDRAFT_231761 [Aspergillus tubingensis CBS 134.48]
MTSHLRQSIQGGGPRCLYSNLAWFLISHPDHEVKRRIKIPKLSSVPKIPIAWPVPWIALAPLNLSADTRQEEGLVWPIHFHPLPSTPPTAFLPPTCYFSPLLPLQNIPKQFSPQQFPVFLSSVYISRLRGAISAFSLPFPPYLQIPHQQQ